MTGIYEVVRSIAVYLILVTVLLNLLSGKSYKKYVELVCGMVLIIIVLAPVTEILSLDDDFLYNFNLSSFKIEAIDGEILAEAESIQKNQIAQKYKTVLIERIAAIVEQEGREMKKAEITLSEEDYGIIEEVLVEIGKNEEAEAEKIPENEEDTGLVEPVQIEDIQLSQVPDEIEKNMGEIREKNKTTEIIRKNLASAFAMKEEQIIVYEKGE